MAWPRAHVHAGIAVLDITAEVRAALEASSVQEGCVNVLSRHTTTAVTINEAEPRLMDDIRQVWAVRVCAGSMYGLRPHGRSGPGAWNKGCPLTCFWRYSSPRSARSAHAFQSQ
eukprot:362247-Chlamydomonas_euryale.AAC.4